MQKLRKAAHLDNVAAARAHRTHNVLALAGRLHFLFQCLQKVLAPAHGVLRKGQRTREPDSRNLAELRTNGAIRVSDLRTLAWRYTPRHLHVRAAPCCGDSLRQAGQRWCQPLPSIVCARQHCPALICSCYRA